MLDLTTFHTAINNSSLEEPVFIYIGVGAASGFREHKSSLWQKLSPDQYQQFPPFLQDVRNKIPNVNLFLLLIDPMQENPPCVAIDYKMAEDTKDNYKSEDGRLQAFVYRELVYTDVDVNPAAKAVNMTQNLRDLNNLAKEKGASLLYHNFTGRNTATLLAEHFDTENLEHLDQIIYSLSAREDHGCFFDLTQPNATFPFRLAQAPAAQAPAVPQAPAAHQKRPIIKMFNFYKYIANNCYEKMAEELEEYPAEMRPLEEVQRNQIINNIRNQFKNVNLSILRHVRNLIFQQAPSEAAAGEAAASEAAPSEAAAGEAAAGEAAAGEAALAGPEVYLFNDIPHLYREIFSELYKEQDFSLLYELMFNYCASELNIFAHLKKMTMTGEELLTFITMEDDPYKWYNNIAIML